MGEGARRQLRHKSKSLPPPASLWQGLGGARGRWEEEESAGERLATRALPPFFWGRVPAPRSHSKRPWKSKDSSMSVPDPSPPLTSIPHCLSKKMWPALLRHEKSRKTDNMTSILLERMFAMQTGKPGVSWAKAAGEASDAPSLTMLHLSPASVNTPWMWTSCWMMPVFKRVYLEGGRESPGHLVIAAAFRWLLLS